MGFETISSRGLRILFSLHVWTRLLGLVFHRTLLEARSIGPSYLYNRSGWRIGAFVCPRCRGYPIGIRDDAATSLDELPRKGYTLGEGEIRPSNRSWKTATSDPIIQQYVVWVVGGWVFPCYLAVWRALSWRASRNGRSPAENPVMMNIYLYRKHKSRAMACQLPTSPSRLQSAVWQQTNPSLLK